MDKKMTIREQIKVKKAMLRIALDRADTAERKVKDNYQLAGELRVEILTLTALKKAGAK